MIAKATTLSLPSHPHPSIPPPPSFNSKLNQTFCNHSTKERIIFKEQEEYVSKTDS